MNADVINADIVIPTCTPRRDVAALEHQVLRTRRTVGRLVATSQPTSAAANRNYGLDRCRAPYVVMIDDDVTALPDGWDARLVLGLEFRPEVVMVSARLVNPGGTPGQMLGDPPLEPDTVEVERGELPTACIAIHNDGTRFDEGYVGSGWEDTDFCARLRGLYPDGKFLVANGVRVVHSNERKHQGVHFAANRARYESIWGEPLGKYGGK